MPEGNVTGLPALSGEPRKILLLRFSSLGDIVMATAMVRCVRRRFPHARIDMAVRADFLDLIRHNPHLDNKLSVARGDGTRGLRDLVQRINTEGYDLVYDAHRSLRTLGIMPLVKAPHKAYFRKHYVRRSLGLTFKLKGLLSSRRLLERYVEPLAPYGVRYDGAGPEIFLSEPARDSARAKIALEKPQGGHLIGIVPSAQWPGKRWPLDRFRELMERLVAETPHRLVVFGGREDDFCEALCRGLPQDRVRNVQGRLSLGESAAGVGECDFVIANDTGLMHVADALGKPSVLFLGPTSAEMGCLPFHPLSRVLEHELWCRPCSKNGQAPCIRGRRLCLELTSVDDAFRAATAISESLRKGADA